MSVTLPVCSLPDGLVNSVLLGLGDGAYYQDQPQHLIDHHQFLEHSIANQVVKGCEIPRSMACSGSLASELAKQRMEIDWFLQLENQRLRTLVREKAKQQAVLLQRYESKIMNLMHQKYKDLEISRIRNVELQNLVVSAEVEAQEWQRKAMDNEAMIIALNNRLQLIKALDAESVFCESSNGEDHQKLEKLGCKVCKARSLSIVFLPCRHLSSCPTCEPLLEVCPLCESVKDGSIEIFLE